jgi:hypothetical protein
MAARNSNFFTASDIILIRDAAGKSYDLTDIADVVLSDQVKAEPWGKTLHWHDLVLAQLPGFKGETSTRWHNRGQSFSKYTWTRIYKEGDEGKDIFFTLGIDGPSELLVYKLDYKQEGASRLNDYQKEVCEELIKSSPARWVEIAINDLPEYNWNRLVDETVAFIKKYERLYDNTVNEVWNPNQKRLARIAYNEESWQRPSGYYGKSKSKDSHECKYGYGNEEWLFDKEKIINGYHYAFLEPIYKYYDLYKGQKFDITLYTVDADTSRRYWVGEIKDLEVINEEEARYVWGQYEKKEWLISMKDEIKAVGGKLYNFPSKDAVQLFNVRFKPSDGMLYDAAIEVPPDNPLFKINRYVLLNNEKKYNTVNFTTDTFDFANTNSPLPSEQNSSKKQYERPPRVVEMKFLHKEISDKLHRHFAKIYGLDKVKTNVRSGYGCNEVDMIIERNDEKIKGYVYYEIKTYDSLRLSIREALGQILEYAMWPDKNRATKFVIVTQPCPNEVDTAKKYFENLRKSLKINICYQSFDTTTGDLSDEM